MYHPLDRPIWSALTTRQAHLATGDARALRIDPEIGLFAAAADRSPESLAALAALAPREGVIGLVEPDEPPVPPAMVMVSSALCHQMMAHDVDPRPAHFPIIPLTDDDAPAMLALATLTRPGPYFSRTHELGGFVGAKVDGRLVAMAGERMKPDGFTEVSGVCTHPDHRGHGYAAALMAHVTARILARGEIPFLHSYSDNAGAIALYEKMGFHLRRQVMFTLLARA
ncbi:GNAT family N-acetyltransferase [Sphingomonas sp. MMS24-J13]|uniref:GNAT family N-acetyltransferase n=1 Tax=Sphingomonas sp. MMS24-J13 TaxID=3238686 RepID=UPI00384E4BEF